MKFLLRLTPWDISQEVKTVKMQLTLFRSTSGSDSGFKSN
jgi:hypothetical protein